MCISIVGLERATGFEPATLGLGSRCSTAELHPRSSRKNIGGDSRKQESADTDGLRKNAPQSPPRTHFSLPKSSGHRGADYHQHEADLRPAELGLAGSTVPHPPALATSPVRHRLTSA